MIEKAFVDNELEIELTSYIDDKQNIWFKGKDVAQILGYNNKNDAIIKHVSEKYILKKSASRVPSQNARFILRPFLMQNLGFMNQFSSLNYQLLKNSKAGCFTGTPIHQKIWAA